MTLASGKRLGRCEIVSGRVFAPIYDVSPDGQRFLMVEGESESGPARLHLVLNWAEELKRRAPVED